MTEVGDADGIALEVTVPLRAGDHFGCSTTIVDNYLLVGASGDGWHAGVNGAGAAYWMQLSFTGYSGASTGSGESAPLADIIEVLTAPDASEGAEFGTAVAAADGYIAIGATGQKCPACVMNVHGHYELYGAVYVWTYTSAPSVAYFRKFMSDAPLDDAHFGCSVLIHGGRLFIGECGTGNYPAGEPQPHHNGHVYVFELASGALVTKLSPVDPITRVPEVACYSFGAQLAISDGVLAVSSPRAKGPCAYGTKWGAVWLYEMRGIWNQTAKLLPPRGVGTSHSEFGFALSWQQRSSGMNSLLVGAPGYAPNGNTDTGAVYRIGPIDSTDVSQHAHVASNSWTPVLGLQVGMGSSGTGRFGQSVSFHSASGLAMVSAPASFSIQGPTSGSVGVTRYWVDDDCAFAVETCGLPLAFVISRKLWAENGETGDEFGMSVSFGSSGIGLIGSNMHDRNVTLPNTGSAYLFLPPPLPPPPWPPSFPPPSTPPSAPPYSPTPSPPAPLPDSSEMLLIIGMVVGSITAAGAIGMLVFLLYTCRSRLRASGARVKALRTSIDFSGGAAAAGKPEEESGRGGGKMVPFDGTGLPTLPGSCCRPGTSDARSESVSRILARAGSGSRPGTAAGSGSRPGTAAGSGSRPGTAAGSGSRPGTAQSNAIKDDAPLFAVPEPQANSWQEHFCMGAVAPTIPGEEIKKVKAAGITVDSSKLENQCSSRANEAWEAFQRKREKRGGSRTTTQLQITALPGTANPLPVRPGTATNSFPRAEARPATAPEPAAARPGTAPEAASRLTAEGGLQLPPRKFKPAITEPAAVNKVISAFMQSDVDGQTRIKRARGTKRPTSGLIATPVPP